MPNCFQLIWSPVAMLMRSPAIDPTAPATTPTRIAAPMPVPSSSTPATPTASVTSAPTMMPHTFMPLGSVKTSGLLPT
ncbi:hypothetical protein BCCR75501_06389 [Burkholderia sola]|nr:hypothetical protein BCCR75501_06389 [Burkholderia cenocepacia]